MPDWRMISDIARSNIVSRACAVISAVTVLLPWLVRRSFGFHNPSPYLDTVAVPPEYFSLLEMVARPFLASEVYTVPTFLSIAAFIFVAGIVVAIWTPIGGIFQVVAAYAIAETLVRSNYLLYQGPIEAEYTLGIGFHIGFIFALVTVFSLCPSGRSALIKGFRIALRRVRPQPA